jgi:hypothetical protein
MSTRPAAFDVRENAPGNVKMAASLDFLHFHHIGWKSFPAGMWKSWETAISKFPHFHVRRDKAALFQWVQGPPGDRSSRKQPGQAWR